MNSTLVKSNDYNSSINMVSDTIILAFIIYMSFVGLIFICCCCKPCLRGIFLCIYNRSSFDSHKKVVKVISNDSQNKVIDLNAVIIQVD